jgi:hypothetical protein
MTKQLFIVHPDTGIIFDLSDEIFLFDGARLPSSEDGADVLEYIAKHVKSFGYRLDNFNMTNLFFGGAE